MNTDNKIAGLGLAPLQSTVAPKDDNYAESLVKSEQEEEKLHIVSFYLNGAEFAFEVSDAVEVLRPRQLTEVPRTPDFIRGILSVRGEMIPVFDLKKRLGITDADSKPSGRILIAAVDDLKAGFFVDRFFGVKEIPKKAIEPPAEGGHVPAEFLKGNIDVNGNSISLLNTLKLIEISNG